MATTESALDRLLGKVASEAGLEAAGSHRPRMVAAAHRRRSRLRLPDWPSYARRLMHDERERAELLESLTVAETYFFREPAQLDVLRHTIVPSLREERGGLGLRVWSAGCATGAEPYTVAIVLAELGELERAEILGTDLSAAAIEQAREAVYAPWALRHCTDEQRAALFRQEGRSFRLVDRYRDAVRFRTMNLIDGHTGGRFDIVLCRNVLIYLTPAAIEAAAKTLHHSLTPGGWLLMGASDPAIDRPGLERMRVPHAVVYRRTATIGQPVPAAVASRVAVDPPKQAPPPDARSTAEGSIAERIRRAGDAGQLEEAGRLTARAIADAPLDAELRYLSATVHLEAGRRDGARRDATAAVYLDPDLIAAHLLLATLRLGDGDVDRARSSLRSALAALRRTPPDDTVALVGGEPAGHLAVVVARELEDLG